MNGMDHPMNGMDHSMNGMDHPMDRRKPTTFSDSHHIIK